MTIFSSQFLRSGSHYKLARLVGLSNFLVGAAAIVLASVQPTHAAERLYFTYGPLGRSFSIEDLRTFAETGEPTRQLQWYLNLASTEPEDFRKVLTKRIPVSRRLINRVTYSLPGEFALSQLGEVIHTKSHRANIQALRAALVLSIIDDSQISILEFLENYPTSGVYVDGVILARVVRNVKDVVEDIEPIVVAVEEILGDLICDCNSDQTTAIPQLQFDSTLLREENDAFSFWHFRVDSSSN